MFMNSMDWCRVCRIQSRIARYDTFSWVYSHEKTHVNKQRNKYPSECGQFSVEAWQYATEAQRRSSNWGLRKTTTKRSTLHWNMSRNLPLRGWKEESHINLESFRMVNIETSCENKEEWYLWSLKIIWIFTVCLVKSLSFISLGFED